MTVDTSNILNFADTLIRQFEQKVDEQGNVSKRGFERGDLNKLLSRFLRDTPDPNYPGILTYGNLIVCSRKYGPVFVAIGAEAFDGLLTPDGEAPACDRNVHKYVCDILAARLRSAFADKNNKPREGWPQYGALIYGHDIAVFKVDSEHRLQWVEFEGKRVHHVLWGRIIRLLDEIVSELQIPDEMGTN